MGHWNPRLTRAQHILDNKRTRERQQLNRRRGFDHCAPRERVYNLNVGSHQNLGSHQNVEIGLEEARARTALLQADLDGELIN